jgi:hypothetical protein
MAMLPHLSEHVLPKPFAASRTGVMASLENIVSRMLVRSASFLTHASSRNHAYNIHSQTFSLSEKQIILSISVSYSFNDCKKRNRTEFILRSTENQFLYVSLLC